MTLDVSRLVPYCPDVTTTMLTEREAALHLRRSSKTLRNWRSEGKGPAFLRMGGRVFYHLADIARWIAQETTAPPDDESGRR